MKIFSSILAAGLLLAANVVHAETIYLNGFETNTFDWSAATRVPSGTNGIPSADGSFHAQAVPNNGTITGTFSRWGGYNYGAGNAVPTAFLPYTTSVDVYLNVSGGWANDTQFDFSSAINNAAGTHLRDFIFNGGFYNDAGGPGSLTNRFVFTASNNSQPGSAFAKNPARNPIAISDTGWYTFEHDFYASGGMLNVDMSIYDAANNLQGTWHFATDPINTVGGNRYGWFNFNEFSPLAIDNAQLTLNVPEPASLALWSIVTVAGTVMGYRRKRSMKGSA